ncbi:MAG: NAD(P)-dependent oxidoreductase [bacterium]
MERIAWIGTGIMGAPMSRNLAGAGYSVTAYNRTLEKAEALRPEGIEVAPSIKAAVGEADMVFTIVGYPEDLREVYFGEDGILNHAAKGSVLIDMTTSRPKLAEEIAAASRDVGCTALDAPVSGGDVGAREGTLSIMVGGDREAFDRAKPLFEVMGKTISLLGPAGAGQHTKMANQILIASTMVGVVESLLYAEKAGLDRDEVIGIIGQGAAASWSINNLGPRITAGNFEPGFIIDHFVKDMGIALDEAARMRLSLPGLALARQFYVAAQAEGLSRKGTQALYRVLARLNEGA